MKVLWVSRSEPVDIFWDMTSADVPLLPPDAVVLHLAGVIRGSEEELARNVAMIKPLLEACAASGARGLLFASTAAVYPQEGEAAQESDVDPVNAYGRSKLEAEIALEAGAGRLPWTALRLGNIAGADALLGQNRDSYQLDPVPDGGAGPLRSWIGPQSLARVIENLVEKLYSGESLPKAINVAAQPALRMGDILDAAGKPWRFGPENPAVVPSATLATDLLSRICGEIQVTPTSLVNEVTNLT